MLFAAYCQSEPLFSEEDYEIARNALREMSDLDFKIVYFRFWKNRSLLEIAAYFGMSWLVVDRRLKRSMNSIREKCLSDPRFSRNDPFQQLLTALHLQ